MAPAPPPHPTPEDAPATTVSVLGPVRAWRQGEEVALGGRRQRAVLARLALAAGQVVAADRLVEDLWAGAPPPSAANSLQSYVSNLRRLLGPVGDGPAIERVADGYRLAVHQPDQPAARFEALVAAGTRTGAADPLAAVARLDEALAQWHGAALDGFEDQAWAQGDAVRLEELRLAATEARFEHLLALGHDATIVGDLEAAAAAHPLRERFTALLVTALYRAGRQGEALRAFERTRTHLAEELGLDPSPDLVRLADAVLERDPTLDGTRPTADPGAIAPSGADTTAAAPAVAGPPSGPVPDLPRLPLPPAVAERRSRSAFVGRADEAAQVLARWTAATGPDADGTELVVLAGEPGLGKTRLAQHLARRLHDDGGQVLWGRCTAETLIAYQPVVEALRTALGALPLEAARHLLAQRPPVGLLVPELAGAPDAPVRTERWELYEAVADLLVALSATGPVLLVIDDLQWADPATLSLLDHLVGHAHDGRLLVLGTVRRPAGRPTPELDALLTASRRDHRLTTVALGGLAAADVTDLLAHRGLDLSGAAADELRSRTGGNPFFLESLADQGGDLAGGDRSVPDSVRDVLDQRLAQLDRDDLRVLTTAAVIGLRVDLAVLGAVADLEPDALLDAVDAAVATGLLAEDEEIGSVTFPHALVRQALVARTTRNREAQLHLRVADAIAARPEAVDRATTVAQHLLAAGRSAPARRTAEAAVAAARLAGGLAADREAATWARHALDALDRLADGSEADPADDTWRLRIDALLLAFGSERFAGGREEAMAALDEAAEVARRHDDPLLLAAIALRGAYARAGIGFPLGTNDPDPTLAAVLEESLAALPAGHPAERAALLAWSSIQLSGGTDRRLQEERSRTALAATSEVTGPVEVIALGVLARRLALAGPAGLAERLALGPRFQAVARDIDDLDISSATLVLVDHLEAGHVAEARQLHHDLHTLAAGHDRPGYQAYVAFYDGLFALLEGDLDRAVERTDLGLALGEPSHGGNAAVIWQGRQLDLARERGTLADLLPTAEAEVARTPGAAIWRTTLAAALLAAGRPDDARTAYAPLVDGDALHLATDDFTWLPAVAQLAEVAHAVGDAPACATLATALAPVADRIAVAGAGALVAGPLRRHHGLALAGAGDLAAAEAVLALAAEEADGHGFTPARDRALADLAAVRRQLAAATQEPS